MNQFIFFLLSFALLPLMLLSAESDLVNLDRLGFRVASDSKSKASIVGYEVYGIASTPWSWDIGGDEQVSVELEGAIGGLSGEGETSIYARFAPHLSLDFKSFPISAVLSVGPTIISEEKFDSKLDLGGHFQFFSSVGFDWHISEVCSAGYRYQHISNAGIYNKNPGLNLHSVSIGYRF